MEDWRLNGQEEYLTNATLCKVVFPAFWEKAYLEKNGFYRRILQGALNHVKNFPDTKDWLEGEKIQHFWHEHCDFCFAKASTDTACEFYCTKDMRYWICKECFHDFQNQFGWKVKSEEELFNES